jgi:hypothetical protein
MGIDPVMSKTTRNYTEVYGTVRTVRNCLLYITHTAFRTPPPSDSRPQTTAVGLGEAVWLDLKAIEHKLPTKGQTTMTQAERTELAAPLGAPVALGAGGSTDNAALDPAADKALLCERISAVLGVRICRLVKFTGKEPTFRMELEETKVEFLSVRKLMSQSAVREQIAASTGKIIRKFKGKDWDQLAQAMLDACVIEQGGEENEREGAARMHVAHYLSETGSSTRSKGSRRRTCASRSCWTARSRSAPATCRRMSTRLCSRSSR